MLGLTCSVFICLLVLDRPLGLVSIKPQKFGFLIQIDYYCGLPSEKWFYRTRERAKYEAKLLAYEAQQHALDQILVHEDAV